VEQDQKTSGERCEADPRARGWYKEAYSRASRDSDEPRDNPSDLAAIELLASKPNHRRPDEGDDSGDARANHPERRDQGEIENEVE